MIILVCIASIMFAIFNPASLDKMDYVLTHMQSPQLQIKFLLVDVVPLDSCGTEWMLLRL